MFLLDCLLLLSLHLLELRLDVLHEPCYHILVLDLVLPIDCVVRDAGLLAHTTLIQDAGVHFIDIVHVGVPICCIFFLDYLRISAKQSSSSVSMYNLRSPPLYYLHSMKFRASSFNSNSNF